MNVNESEINLSFSGISIVMVLMIAGVCGCVGYMNRKLLQQKFNPEKKEA
jgi:hypothetical protein